MSKERHPNPASLVARSEFALVIVTVDRGANGDRLHITFPRSGRSAYVDPLEFELLIASRYDDFERLVQGPMD